MSVAIAHLVGVVVCMMLFRVLVFAASVWESQRDLKIGLDELSIELGVTVSELSFPENDRAVLQYKAKQFSSELLRNRISDLCYWIRMLWEVVGICCEVGLFLYFAHATFTEDLSLSDNAWYALAVAIFFWLTGAVFAYACKLLTGRFPGQARAARKALATEVARRGKSRPI
jgi:hypothetical protein